VSFAAGESIIHIDALGVEVSSSFVC